MQTILGVNRFNTQKISRLRGRPPAAGGHAPRLPFTTSFLYQTPLSKILATPLVAPMGRIRYFRHVWRDHVSDRARVVYREQVCGGCVGDDSPLQKKNTLRGNVSRTLPANVVKSWHGFSVDDSLKCLMYSEIIRLFFSFYMSKRAPHIQTVFFNVSLIFL